MRFWKSDSSAPSDESTAPLSNTGSTLLACANLPKGNRREHTTRFGKKWRYRSIQQPRNEVNTSRHGAGLFQMEEKKRFKMPRARRYKILLSRLQRLKPLPPVLNILAAKSAACRAEPCGHKLRHHQQQQATTNTTRLFLRQRRRKRTDASPAAPAIAGRSFTCSRSKAASAASIPDLIAVCAPLIFTAFRNPAAHPSSAPPGNVSLGREWYPPSLSVLAP